MSRAAAAEPVEREEEEEEEEEEGEEEEEAAQAGGDSAVHQPAIMTPLIEHFNRQQALQQMQEAVSKAQRRAERARAKRMNAAAAKSQAADAAAAPSSSSPSSLSKPSAALDGEAAPAATGNVRKRGGEQAQAQEGSNGDNGTPIAGGDGAAGVDGKPPKAKRRRRKKATLHQTLVRRGKWCDEEEALVRRLIREFKAGNLALVPGTTLRAFVSRLIYCDPMRISKKFVGDDSIGKQLFRPEDLPAGHPNHQAWPMRELPDGTKEAYSPYRRYSPAELEQLTKEVTELEQCFLARCPDVVKAVQEETHAYPAAFVQARQAQLEILAQQKQQRRRATASAAARRSPSSSSSSASAAAALVSTSSSSSSSSSPQQQLQHLHMATTTTMHDPTAQAPPPLPQPYPTAADALTAAAAAVAMSDVAREAEGNASHAAHVSSLQQQQQHPQQAQPNAGGTAAVAAGMRMPWSMQLDASTVASLNQVANPAFKPPSRMEAARGVRMAGATTGSGSSNVVRSTSIEMLKSLGLSSEQSMNDLPNFQISSFPSSNQLGAQNRRAAAAAAVRGIVPRSGGAGLGGRRDGRKSERAIAAAQAASAVVADLQYQQQRMRHHGRGRSGGNKVSSSSNCGEGGHGGISSSSSSGGGGGGNSSGAVASTTTASIHARSAVGTGSNGNATFGSHNSSLSDLGGSRNNSREDMARIVSQPPLLRPDSRSLQGALSSQATSAAAAAAAAAAAHGFPSSTSSSSSDMGGLVPSTSFFSVQASGSSTSSLAALAGTAAAAEPVLGPSTVVGDGTAATAGTKRIGNGQLATQSGARNAGRPLT